MSMGYSQYKVGPPSYNLVYKPFKKLVIYALSSSYTLCYSYKPTNRYLGGPTEWMMLFSWWISKLTRWASSSPPSHYSWARASCSTSSAMAWSGGWALEWPPVGLVAERGWPPAELQKMYFRDGKSRARISIIDKECRKSTWPLCRSRTGCSYPFCVKS